MVVSYPIIGYVLGYMCNQPDCFRKVFLFFAVYQLALVPYIYFCFKPVVLEKGNIEKEPQVKGSLRDYWKRYKYYVIADVLFITAWSLAPGLALVYFVMEWLGGNMFHIALIEAVISTATLTGTWIVDRISENKAFKALQAGTLVTITGLALMISAKSFILVLIASYIVRMGDSLVFVFKRTWLFSIMSKLEASKASATLSSIRRVISIVSPTLVGGLAYLDPRAPYIACLILLASTIPIYMVASRRVATLAKSIA